MADDENKNEQAEEKAPEEQAPEAGSEEQPAAEETQAGDAPAGEAAAEGETPAEEAPAEEAPADEAPAEDEPPADEAPAADAGETPAADGDAGGEDELEGMDWKARARIQRSRESGEAGPQRSPEERAAERESRRAAAAARRRSYRKRGRERRKGSGEGTAPAQRDAVAPKTRQGTVVSNKADKTITVRIDIVRRHPAYEKIVRRSSKLHAHDEGNEANEGDVVRLVETRPLSRTKRWRLAEILEKAK